MENIISSIQDFLVNTFAAMSGLAAVLLVIGCILFALIVVYFIRIHIAYKMAQHRHRDPLAWALLSFFVSPLLTWIILLIVGDAH